MDLLSMGVFWLASACLFWGYLGYPLFVATAGRYLLPSPPATPRPVGDTIVVISAYNEEATIDAKVANSLEFVSEGALRVVIISDGSTDGTDQVASSWAQRDGRVELLRVEGRVGKSAALNEAMRRLDPGADDVVVFTDANAILEDSAAQYLRSSLERGAVCAVGKLEFIDASTGTAKAEGLYWRYENRLKQAEGRIGRNPFANGANFAVRAGDVPNLPADVGNDFWIPVFLLGQGGRVVYEPNAKAVEPAPEHAGEELRRKIRMANRQMTGVLRAWPQVDAATRFQLVSHKVLRWIALPLLVLALCATVPLLDAVLYRAAALVLVVPGFLALISATLRPLGLALPMGSTAGHFFLVQWAALIGVIQALRGQRQETWDAAESARRQVN